jgi:hypothetical protein
MNNTVQAVTADEVIKNRQSELIIEINEIEKLEMEMRQQLEMLNHKKRLRLMEYEMMEKFDERNMVSFTTTTTTIEIGRKKSSDKLSFEDTLKQVMDNAGRPITIGQIITELEKFGHQWSKYVSAYNYLTNSGMIEKVPQTRGIYQLIRSR